MKYKKYTTTELVDIALRAQRGDDADWNELTDAEKALALDELSSYETD